MLVIYLKRASFAPNMKPWIWVTYCNQSKCLKDLRFWQVTKLMSKISFSADISETHYWTDFIYASFLFVYIDIHLFWCYSSLRPSSHLILTCVPGEEVSRGQLRRVVFQTCCYECVFSDHLKRWSDFIHRFSRRKGSTYISCISLLLHLRPGRNVL